MMQRRQFLKLGTAFLIGAPSDLGATTPKRLPSFTLLHGIDEETSAEGIALVLGHFAEANFPLTISVDPGIDPRGAVGQAITKALEAGKHLIEVAPFIPGLASQSPYFQARAAAEAASEIRASFGELLAAEAPVGVVCLAVENPPAPFGLRGVGIRTVMMLDGESEAVASERWDDGTVRLAGGSSVRLSNSAAAFSRVAGVAHQHIPVLDAKTIARTPEGRLSRLVRNYIEVARSPGGGGAFTHLTLSEAQLRDAYDFQRKLAVRLVGEVPTGDGTKEFTEELLELGVPFSLGDRTGFSVGLESHGAIHQQPIHIDSHPIFRGMDDRNVLHVSGYLIDGFGRIPETLGQGTGDGVILVAQGVLAKPATRMVLLRDLKALRSNPSVQFAALPEIVENYFLPRSPYLTHLRRTDTAKAHGALTDDAAPLGRDALLADAKLAWSYFERWTNPKTGLCPATAYFGPGERRLHEAVTMWDVGSHILAIISAHKLGLIGDRELRRACKRIMPQIAGRVYQGRRLPQGWIRTDRDRWGTKDFDASDAGRLLSALHNLKNYPTAGIDPTSIVENYDLEAMIIEGAIHSFKDGELKKTFRSHSAHYAARSFRNWGLSVDSPYEVSGKLADGQVALLEAAGRIGPLGAEPLLSEALELGMSPEAAYLADVLFAAQLEEYTTTGTLKAVSESPIDRDPWFIYTGLQLDAPGRTWSTDTADSLPAHRSREFAEENAVLSPKAAYLWAAYKPHIFSRELVGYVRAKAKTKYGFSVAIYENEGRGIEGYSDINTNAVILESIAHMLAHHPKGNPPT